MSEYMLKQPYVQWLIVIADSEEPQQYGHDLREQINEKRVFPKHFEEVSPFTEFHKIGHVYQRSQQNTIDTNRYHHEAACPKFLIDREHRIPGNCERDENGSRKQ